VSYELLQILAKKTNYDRFFPFVENHYFDQREFKLLLKDFQAYFEKTQKNSIDWEQFQLWFKTTRHPSLGETKHLLFDKIFRVLQTKKTPDDALHNEILHSFILKDFGKRIGEVGLSAHDGDVENLDDIYDLLEQYDVETEQLKDADQLFSQPNLNSFIQQTSTKGLRWKLKFFNSALGPLRKGDFIIFGARPDGGKTTLLCNEATHMAKQIDSDQCVLIINNEGTNNRYYLRLAQIVLNRTRHAIEQDPHQTLQDYYAAIGGQKKIQILKSAGPVTVRKVERAIKSCNPGLIIFDQLYKVNGFAKQAAGMEVARQGLIFQWARSLAIEHCPVMTVHQADGTAEGAKYISAAQLYGSKTAIQGEADAIITMGRQHDTGDSRFLSIEKNKLLGGPHSSPALRHGKAEVTLIPETGQFKEN